MRVAQKAADERAAVRMGRLRDVPSRIVPHIWRRMKCITRPSLLQMCSAIARVSAAIPVDSGVVSLFSARRPAKLIQPDPTAHKRAVDPDLVLPASVEASHWGPPTCRHILLIRRAAISGARSRGRRFLGCRDAWRRRSVYHVSSALPVLCASPEYFARRTLSGIWLVVRSVELRTGSSLWGTERARAGCK